MGDTVTIWHNPRCSKSRQTLAILEDHGVEIIVRRYLDDAPSPAELRVAETALGLPPSQWVRSGEKLFKDLGLSKTDAPDRLLGAMAEHPILIERPIVFRGDRAVIGRPPEAVEALLA